MTNQQIDPNDPDLIADIEESAAKGYSPDQVAVDLNLPFGPFMYALMREPAIKHAWDLGMLQYANRFLRIAEDIAENPLNKQALAAAIYCHRHSENVRLAAQRLRPETNMLNMGDALRIEELIEPETMKLAMKDYKDRQNESARELGE